jgi:hypothetical protein
MEKILIDLEFKDITNEVPITFIECLPIGFENVYPINKRFKRVKSELTTFILIGKEHNFIMGYGDSYYKNNWSRFHFAIPEKHFKEHFLSLLNANENKILTTEYNTDTSVGHPFKDDDIVRYSEETQRVQDKELEH